MGAHHLVPVQVEADGGDVAALPVAKVILERLLESAGKADGCVVDSAGCFGDAGAGVSLNARKAIRELYGEDLLRSHEAKVLTQDLIQQAKLILVMEKGMKRGFPAGKTFTLREYVGEAGDIPDPLGGSLADYIPVAVEMKRLLTSMVPRLE